MALSGGGYRAAAFHLGLLDVLHASGLLDQVVALSTVSGGTIVGAAYVLAVARGQDFPTFYREFYEQLHQRPLDNAVQILVGSEARQLPTATLIAAQAEVYDRIFFRQAKFGEILQANTRLREIAFNATDFAAGLPFRFQKSSRERVRIGNGRHVIPSEIAAELRLADIVAASSCFPAGFEPFAFPDDFQWSKRAEIKRKLAEQYDDRFHAAVPLMDGGVADNQGVDSLLTAIDRLDKNAAETDRVGLILISDVSQRAQGPLLAAAVRPQRGGLRVSWFLGCARLLFVAATASLVGLGWQLVESIRAGNVRWWPDLVTVYFPLALSLLLVVALAVTRSIVKTRLIDRLPRTGLDVPRLLKRMPLRLLLDLLWLRAQSLIAMSGDVFMKSIRDLRYRELYSSDEYRNRTVANLIYKLSESQYHPPSDLPEWRKPTTEMQQIAERAASMPTILWFEHDRQLPEVVSCGRFTTCHTLLNHLVERYGADFERADDDTRPRCRKLREIWTTLQKQALLEPTQPLADT